MCLDCKFGACVQNCVCLLVCQECVGADGYVSACVDCTTCSKVRSLLFITSYICYVLFACECNVTKTNSYAHFNVTGK